jgi:uncharacterized protein YqeY
VIAIVDKLIKQRKDSVAAYILAARQDLADKESAEMTVLQAYLPQRLSADEVATAVKAIVDEIATESGRAVAAGDMGKVMGVVKTRLAGKADMSLVSAAVKEALK